VPDLVRLTVACVTAVISQATLAQYQPNLSGTWEWTRKSDGCSEQYVFRDDGVLLVHSGENRTENTFLMAWEPELNGRYKLTLTTERDLGGRDCSGSTGDRAGRRAVGYLLFSHSRETMLLCASAEGADCIGPLKRTAR